MLRLRFVLAALMVSLLGIGWLLRDSSHAALPKIRGTLPANFGKLGLSTEQKQKIYKIRKTYREQIDDLKAKIADLRRKERAEFEKVLTPEQAKKLRELRTGEKEPEPKKDKKKKAKKDKKAKDEPARTKDK
jgi:Spy/CpxP family protein refolding chaperone